MVANRAGHRMKGRQGKTRAEKTLSPTMDDPKSHYGPPTTYFTTKTNISHLLPSITDYEAQGTLYAAEREGRKMDF